MLKKCSVILITAFVFSTVGYFLMPTQEAEAGATKIITTIKRWKKVAEDGSVCSSGATKYVKRYESLLHKIFGRHPHSTTKILRSVKETIFLDIPTCW